MTIEVIIDPRDTFVASASALVASERRARGLLFTALEVLDDVEWDAHLPLRQEIRKFLEIAE